MPCLDIETSSRRIANCIACLTLGTNSKGKTLTSLLMPSDIYSYYVVQYRAGGAGPVAPALAGPVFHSQNIENLAMSQYTFIH